ncbi:MAG: T9SS type A sorting domain-containing protein [Bacteroidetes bacterium]|nr:T9SS type A sorting domain-containing protein [Bacteroidota bacterium]
MLTVLAVTSTTIANAQIVINGGYEEVEVSKDQLAPVDRIAGSQIMPAKNIIGAPICPSINSLNMVDLGYDKVLVDWTSSLNFDSILFRFSVSGSLTSRIISIPGSPNPERYFIRGLLSQTTYDIEISTKCGIIYSAWSAPITVTTLIEPGPKFSANAITNTEHNVKLVPNPADLFTKIKFNTNSDDSNVEIKVSTQAGRIIYSQSVITRLGLNEIPLDVSTFAPGIYFVSVTNERVTAVEKLVVY